MEGNGILHLDVSEKGGVHPYLSEPTDSQPEFEWGFFGVEVVTEHGSSHHCSSGSSCPTRLYDRAVKNLACPSLVSRAQRVPQVPALGDIIGNIEDIGEKPYPFPARRPENAHLQSWLEIAYGSWHSENLVESEIKISLLDRKLITAECSRQGQS